MLEKLYKYKFYIGLVLVILGSIDLYVIGICMIFITGLAQWKYLNYLSIIPILIGGAFMGE